MNPALDNLVNNEQHLSVKLEVNVNELNTIMGALQELPHRIADPILKKVFGQAQSQLGSPAQ